MGYYREEAFKNRTAVLLFFFFYFAGMLRYLDRPMLDPFTMVWVVVMNLIPATILTYLTTGLIWSFLVFIKTDDATIGDITFKTIIWFIFVGIYFSAIDIFGL